MLRRRPPVLPSPATAPGGGRRVAGGSGSVPPGQGSGAGDPGAERPGRSGGGSRSGPARLRRGRVVRRGRLPRRGRVVRRGRLRRWGAALLAALAGFLGVTALTPRGAAAPGVPTVVAASDLPAGAVLGEGDLVVEPRPPSHRPDTAVADPGRLVGAVLAAPLSAKEVVTSSRLRGPGLLSGQPSGTVAMSVPVLDPEAAGVTSGSRVDLYASGSGDRVASDVTVLAARVPEASTWSSGGAASLTLALDPQSAAAVARSVSTLQAGEIFVVALRAG